MFIYLPSNVIARMADPAKLNVPNVVKDRILTSPFEAMFTPDPVAEGNAYLAIEAMADKWLEDEGDWEWLHYVLDGTRMTAREGLDMAKRMAVFLKQRLGLSHGESVHLCVGNHNMTHPTALGTWILGAVASVGDLNLEVRGVASQLDDISARAAFCSPETADLMKAAVKSCRNPERVSLFW